MATSNIAGEHTSSNVPHAGAHVVEYDQEPNPRAPVPPVRDQLVPISTGATVSEPFAQNTTHITVRVGLNARDQGSKDVVIYYDLGIDPQPGIAAKQRDGEIDKQCLCLSVVRGASVAIPVGTGQRIAFLGVGLSRAKGVADEARG